MRVFVLVLGLFGSISASADTACSALSSYIGTYQLLSRECNGPADGVFLQLEVVANAGAFTIWHGDIGVMLEDNDKCTVSEGKVVVQTCATGASCLPKDWYYTFTKDRAVVSMNRCTSTLAKIK